MHRLIQLNTIDDIPEGMRNTPVEDLIRFHNWGHPHEEYTKAVMLVGMCMDNRKLLRVPDSFAFIIRTGGANLRYSEFKVSFAIAVGGVKHIVLMGHNKCGMVNLASNRESFIDGLVKIAGWERPQAEEHFMHYAPLFEIGNEIDFVIQETERIQKRYPQIQVHTMYYNVDENKLYALQRD
ncbi:MAG: carbonic anhydrase [Bacteroidales bacterium]|nr:carbonic anhydrase [Bacteroidales bacterium]